MKAKQLLITLGLTLSLGLAFVWGLRAQPIQALAQLNAEPVLGSAGRVQAPIQVSGDPVQPAPHPILSDLRVRQAIAYCTNKDALIAAAYPDLTPEERQALVMETFVPESSWAYSEPSIFYDYNPTQGQALLEQAGWLLPGGDDYRVKDGQELFLQLNTTDATLRLTFLPVFEVQMQACGIRVLRNHLPANWLFGVATGLVVRDFEMSDFAWGSGDDPEGYSLYACDQIPAPENGWTGQNFMGWCNQAASDAITLASDTNLPQDQRAAYYATFIDLFAEDLPSLPLFLREEDSGTYWEHIDFNLETYAQDGEVLPEGTDPGGLIFSDYQGLQHTIAAPAGAVTATIGLRYYPLIANSQPLPGDLVAANAFRLNAVIGGVPQAGFVFEEPITVTVGYDLDLLVYHMVESSLVLYAWDTLSSAWIDAAETCPVADRYKNLDMINNRYIVQVCHLSEFGLFGRGGDSIRMGVDYWRNEASGMYNPGHTFWVRVSSSGGAVKATATVVTEAGGAGTGTGELFAWSDGFWVQPLDWSDPNMDIVPGDLVYFESDDGFSETITVGTIAAEFNPYTNSGRGKVTAPGLDYPLSGWAGKWGWFYQEFTTDWDGTFFVDFSPFDLALTPNVSVVYWEPDGDAVHNGFTVQEYRLMLPRITK